MFKGIFCFLPATGYCTRTWLLIFIWKQQQTISSYHVDYSADVSKQDLSSQQTNRVDPDRNDELRAYRHKYSLDFEY